MSLMRDQFKLMILPLNYLTLKKRLNFNLNEYNLKKIKGNTLRLKKINIKNFLLKKDSKKKF